METKKYEYNFYYDNGLIKYIISVEFKKKSLTTWCPLIATKFNRTKKLMTLNDQYIK